MTYITGSITNANPGPLLYAAMETELLAEGFTLEDTVVISTKTHKILKSPAGSNSLGIDWYLDVTYNATGITNGIQMRTFEFFDTATDLAYRGPGFSSSVVSEVFDEPTWSWAGSNGYALDTNWVTSGPKLNTTTSAFTYRISITPDRVIMLLSNVNTTLLYAGFYVPDEFFADQAGAEMVPLMCANIGGGSISFLGYLTRLPMVLDGSIHPSDTNLYVNGASYLNGRYLSRDFVTTPVSGQQAFYVAWPVKLIAIGDFPYGGPIIGELMDVKYTRGNSSGTHVVGDTASVTTNPALTGGDEYVIVQRGTHMHMFRTL